MSNIPNWVEWAAPLGVAFGGVALTWSLAYTLGVNQIPTASKVQSGYVVPSKLEIKLKDLDGNGENEVLMKYNGKSYLLTLDQQGNPRVQAYEFKPAEVVPKQ